MIKFPSSSSGRPVYLRRTEPIESIGKLADEAPVVEREVFVERRRHSDRRSRRADRGRFDMRSGRDRRKNQPGSISIDIDA